MRSKVTSFLRCNLLFILIIFRTIVISGCTEKKDKAPKGHVIYQEEFGGWTISSYAVTRAEFKDALKNNINAPFVTSFADSLRLEKAVEAINKTYTDSEKDLAKQELCKTPRCLTTFKAFYPGFDLLLFNIADKHYVKAAFVKASSNVLVSGDQRYNGDFGVLSKNGDWIGLKREGSNNFLQLELCRYSNGRFWSYASANFTTYDIDEKEPQPIFWTDENTFYIAVNELNNIMPTHLTVYYVFKTSYKEPQF